MNTDKPIFIGVDKWIVENVFCTFDLNSNLVMEGSFHIIVGNYLSHKLYIRGEWEYFIENKQGHFTLIPFPGGTFIFDLETLGEGGDYDKACDILDDMWDKYDNICDKAWIEYQEYFISNAKELTEKIIKTLYNEDYNTYKQLTDFIQKTENTTYSSVRC